ncbi:MAG: phytanoyl-CoA dioxygenase family protein [Cyanobacteria bacterium]|nr:phytanoyl-CoA dioxygenase family protein [Cyanobacteriota bacterium]MDW8200087.1 phytanoyl-CoA dioxygenase family protein [Cyanobacteriota bacterium SKYGB_h_bin112]
MSICNAIGNTTIANALEGELGYFTGIRLLADELVLVKGLIESQWLDTIQQSYPDYAQQFADRGIDRYHELSHLVDHSTLWHKRTRILPASAVSLIRSTSLFKQLEAEFGNFDLSDEEGNGRESIYWRLVRPHQPTDVGPIHADKWFWDLNGWAMPPETQRVKVWIAIVCEPGLGGLRIAPGSHRQDVPYHGVIRHGIPKPQIDLSEDELPLELFQSQPGDAIVFHDRLLHGGSVTSGTLTRVSLEFTAFIPNATYFVR